MKPMNRNNLIDRINGLFKEYIKTQKQIEAEKEACLLEMEYTPVSENHVLQSVLKMNRDEYNPDEVLYPNDLKPADYAVYQDIILNKTAYSSETRSWEIKEEALSCCRKLAGFLDTRHILEDNRSLITAQVKNEVEQYFLTRKLGNPRNLSVKSLESILFRYTTKEGCLNMNTLRRICFPSKSASEYLLGFVSKNQDPLIGKSMQVLKKARDLMGITILDELRKETGGNKYAETFLLGICRDFTKDRIMDLIARNPNYDSVFAQLLDSRQRSTRITQGLLNAIPETYPELFPFAREMQRHFVLHIGPTNSGKSYAALEALKEADTGIYLAPLRLLAYEKYEELNEAGVWCSLKTGEEEIQVPGALIRSSTIEVLDFSKTYDVAVIDEAQMVADPQRGNAWTMALLGVQANIIHVCLAPEAEKVLIQIIRACDDTYEIVRHERLVPLTIREYGKPVFPKNAQEGDAFIVFSRRDVHAAASELQRYGHKCSVIYGNLPYDVRREEVKRYTGAQTDIVVATDAIGMGLNLPIKRIVFLEMTKFDGVDERSLLPSEIRQIAGRAGRFGIFPEGIVTSDTEFSYMKSALMEIPEQIRKARIGFPYSLIGIEGPVSELMDRWSHIRPKPGFDMADMSREIELARILEKDSSDKDLIYRFVMFPFDEKNETLKMIWYDLFKAELSGKSDFIKWLPLKPSRKSENLK